MRYQLIIFFLSISTTFLTGQGIGINDTGAEPDPSALLDVSSAEKGLLAPRMTTSQREGIPSPATGLIVFDLNTESFWCYAGAEWVEVLAGFIPVVRDTDGDTRIEVEENTDDDTIRFFNAGVEFAKMDGKTFSLSAPGNNLYLGKGAGEADPGSANSCTAIGINALQSNLSGSFNTAVGYNAMNTNQHGTGCTAVGSGSLHMNSGSWNTAVGLSSMHDNTIGAGNTAVGTSTLTNNMNGHANCAFGAYAMLFNTSGTSNAAIGYEALKMNSSGTSNVAIGYQAMTENVTGHENFSGGRSSLSNNVAGDQNTAIGGSTMLNNVGGSRNVAVGHNAGFYSLNGNNNTMVGHSAGRGTVLHSKTGCILIGFQAGYADTTDNKLYIENSSSSNPLIYGEFDNDLLRINGRLEITNGFTDKDGDTKIDLEKNADDDLIRFNPGGTEHFVMDGARLEILNSGNSIFIGEGAGANDDLTNNRSLLIGPFAGNANQTGDWNVAMGVDALRYNTVGARNVAIGHIALRDATGFNNVAVGVDAGQQSTGNDNIFIGFEAGKLNTTGSGNVFIGRSAGENSNVSNRLFIDNSNTTSPLVYGEFDNNLFRVNGNMIIYNGANDSEIQIGTIEKIRDGGSNTLKTNTHFLPETDNFFNLGNSSNRWNTVWAGDGTINTSDVNDKKNIRPVQDGLSKALALNPVYFQWKDGPDQSDRLGLIAQEVRKILPEAVKATELNTMEDGSVTLKETERLGLSYSSIIPILIKSIQEQQAIIEIQQSKIDQLSQRLSVLENK